jgi:outer membrane protein OmpA-like peptidoglycan-associated protein
MQLRSALLAATVLATPIAASAQPVTGLYVGAGVGVNFTMQQSISRQGAPVTFGNGTSPIFGTVGGDLKGSSGFVGLVSLGWGFGNGLRAEIEGNYRYNSNSGFSGGNAFGLNGSSVSGGSREQKFGPMVNLLYDFNGVSSWVVPYLGVGVGYQAINENWNLSNTNGFSAAAFSPTATANFFPGSIHASGHSTEGSFAYQAILGAAFPFPSIPGLAITAEYRFLGTAGTRDYSGAVTATGISAGNVVTTRSAPAGINLGSNYNHAILVGLRYNFGVAPPPPPPPAPPPVAAPARSYLVFFDWDKATLTDRARQIIREAADNSTKVQYTRIEVNGYTDTSGTPQYNMGLSIRRAKAVQAELIKDGVPGNAISIQGFGDTHLLVPTGPGVREPQNRRVEIILH